jgi:YVTN family beta-propeller protein
VLATNQKTDKIYVANVDGNNISVINGKTNTVIKDIVVDKGPFWVAVNEETNKIYVTNADYNKLYVIDGKTDSVVKTIPLGSGYPIGVALNQETNTIYVAKYTESAIVAIDGETDEIIGAPVAVGTPASPIGCNINTCTNFGSGAFDIAVNEETNRVYVLNLGDNSIAVLDAQSFHHEKDKEHHN